MVSFIFYRAFLGAIAAIVIASTAYDVGLIVLRRKRFKTSKLNIITL